MTTAGVHRTATAFSAAAGVYEQARPGYPPELVRWLAGHVGVGPGARVLDLAAGTGKLTRELVASGASVVAVEPVEGMWRTLAGTVTGAPVVAGVAQALPLGAGTVDVVTVAQAFHWFAGAPAVREIHRVLRPGGHLAVVWNRRDLSDPLQAALERIMAPWRGSAPSHGSGRWRRAIEAAGAAGPRFVPEPGFAVPWRQELDVDGVVARVASISFVASMAEPDKASLLGRVRDAALAGPAPPELPYVAEVHAYRRRP